MMEAISIWLIVAYVLAMPLETLQPGLFTMRLSDASIFDSFTPA